MSDASARVGSEPNFALPSPSPLVRQNTPAYDSRRTAYGASTPAGPNTIPPPVRLGKAGYGNPSASTLLEAEKAEIESERASVEALQSEVEDLGGQIERERAYLDHTDEFEVDAFNAKVRRYNMLLQEAQNAESAFNQRVDSYNARLRAAGQ